MVMNDDNRIILKIDNVSYTASEMVHIYNVCKDAIWDEHDDLKKLYEIFKVKQKARRIRSRDEIIEEIIKRRDVLICSTPDKGAFLKAVKLARKKFIYYGDIDPLVYGILDNLYCSKSYRSLSDDISRDKNFYDKIIVNVCYMMIVNGDESNIKNQIEDDKLWKYKADYDYIDAVKCFSPRYEVGENLELDQNEIFADIYKSITSYSAESIYDRLVYSFAKSFDIRERRIRVNNKLNSELPILWHYVLKSMTSVESCADTMVKDEEYQSIIDTLKKAVVLLEADNEHDLSFLLPNREEGYLEKLMHYSAVYDLHQYDAEGMLFLINRVVEAYSDEIENYFGEKAETVYDIISEVLRIAGKRFVKEGKCELLESEITKQQQTVLDKMVAGKPLNKGYINPLQLDKVDDDSEWIIKKDNKYYIFVPVLSGLGVYDKIGKAIGWKDFGPQIETSVQDLFSNIDGLKVCSGNCIFENEIYEADAIILGDKYALLVECKRKGISRKARGGDKNTALKDLSETYFESQKQAYHTHRVILENNGMLELYPPICHINQKLARSGKYDKEKVVVDFSTVEHFVRVSCTGGNFWIAAEGGIADNIERSIDTLSTNAGLNGYITEFVEEKNRVIDKAESMEMNPKVIQLDRMFISFDKLYSMVKRIEENGKTGDALLHDVWIFTRTQSKKGDTMNWKNFFLDLLNSRDGK